MPEPSISLLSTRPLGAGWPAVRKWKVTDEDGIDGVELVSTHRAGHYVLAHRATSGGKWQATWFDADGPGGDIRRATLEAALNEQAPPGEYHVTQIHLTADRNRENRENPMPNAPQKAIRMFHRFHTRPWRGEGDFHPDLAIPDQVHLLGDAVHVLYRSDKLNPETSEDEGWIDYIHEHSAGVRVFVPATARAPRGGELVRVPATIQRVDQLTWLGASLGFAYRDANGVQREAKGTAPLPELYTIPSGKALLVIQGRRRLLAMIWGGKLGVERRGIVH
jgi:hypothetical protein